jgi:Tat protein translocase TatB subunit
MFYLFILESIGTAELLLIGLVALIIFGPRKLPEFARMLGKAKNEFKRTTDDFRQTWEREVDFEGVEKEVENRPGALASENSNLKTGLITENRILAPEIKEVSQIDFEEISSTKDTLTTKPVENTSIDKRDWL